MTSDYTSWNQQNRQYLRKTYLKDYNTVKDNIALFKIFVKYKCDGEETLIETNFLPFEVSSQEEYVDQYEWIELAMKMLDFKWYQLTTEEFEQIRDSIQVDVRYDHTNVICMN